MGPWSVRCSEAGPPTASDARPRCYGSVCCTSSAPSDPHWRPTSVVSLPRAPSEVWAALYGTVLGSLLGGWPTDRFGRKATLLWIGVLYFVGAVGSDEVQ